MIPAKPFYLLRHGQSEANAAEIAAGGQMDSPLNDKGVSQAKDLGALMSQLDIQPDVVHHSFMIRAKLTAELVNTDISLEMNEWVELREHDLGDWEGRPWLEISEDIESRVAPPNGETHQQFAQRIQATFTDILDQESQKDRLPLIVCHGGVYHALGMLYEYGVSHIQNCHLHYFEPAPQLGEFPWRVTVFDIEDNALVKRPAEFCLSRALSKIA